MSVYDGYHWSNKWFWLAMLALTTVCIYFGVKP